MTDYSEEQRNELEALESIYPDSFTVLSENPTTFTITVTSEAGENGETVQTTLKFTYREKYPDETPLYEIVSQENLDDNDVTDIIKLLEQQVEENLGMVMIFTLVSAVQEKLNEIVDQIKTRREEEKKQKEREAEEEEKQRFHGTPVTIENFLNWKAKFDAELLEIKRKKMKEEEQAGKNKLSDVCVGAGVLFVDPSCLLNGEDVYSALVNSCLKWITTLTLLTSSFWRKLETVWRLMNLYSKKWMI
ncbi:RWD domain-containing protein 1 isoform 2-T2 [Amazona ochrocephala]